MRACMYAGGWVGGWVDVGVWACLPSLFLELGNARACVCEGEGVGVGGGGVMRVCLCV